MNTDTTTPAQAAAEIRRVYQDREVAGIAWAEVRDFAALILERGTDPRIAPDVHPGGEAERAKRLRLAAYADLTALRAATEAADLGDDLANEAILLGWHLRDYDRVYGLGTVDPPASDSIYWEASGLARIYTRKAWLAHYDETPHQQ